MTGAAGRRPVRLLSVDSFLFHSEGISLASPKTWGEDPEAEGDSMLSKKFMGAKVDLTKGFNDPLLPT